MSRLPAGQLLTRLCCSVMGTVLSSRFRVLAGAVFRSVQYCQASAVFCQAGVVFGPEPYIIQGKRGLEPESHPKVHNKHVDMCGLLAA